MPTRLFIALIAVFLFLLPHSTLFGQSLIVSPQNIEVGENETFELNYRLENADMKNWQAPSFADFTVVSGPHQGRSQSIQIVNGQMSQVSSVSLTYMLRPKKVGKFVIPRAIVGAEKGKSLQSEKVNVTVSKGSSKRPQQPRQQPSVFPQIPGFPPFGTHPSTSPSPQQASGEEPQVFARIVVDTPTVYLGEQVTANYRVYSNYNISDYAITAPPAFTGFWVEDLSQQVIPRPFEEKVNGKIYKAVDVKSYALFPQSAGKLRIDQMSVEVSIQIPDPRFGMFHQSLTLKASSDTSILQVNELPQENKPSDFSGAVGNYQLSASLDNPSARTGDARTLSVVISGDGNIKLLSPPNISFPPSIEVYDPQISEDIFTKMDKINGRRVFDYAITPTEMGRVEIPAIAFSYFDLNEKQYKTLRSEPITMQVAQGDKQLAKKDDKISKDLSPISHQTLPKTRQKSWFWGSWLFTLLMLLPLAGLVVVHRRQQQKRRETSNIVAYKSKRASTMALQRLGAARGHLQKQNSKLFYDEMIRILWGYAGDKLQIPVAEMTKERINEGLAVRGVSAKNIDQLLQTLQQAEIALYAPSNVQNIGNLQSIYQQTLALLTDIEQEIGS